MKTIRKWLVISVAIGFLGACSATVKTGGTTSTKASGKATISASASAKTSGKTKSSASASKKGSKSVAVGVGRADKYKPGTKVKVHVKVKAGSKARPATTTQLNTRKKVESKRKADLVAKLKVEKKAKAKAKQKVQVKAKECNNARAKTRVSTNMRLKAEKKLAINIKTREKTKADLEKKKKMSADRRAKGKGKADKKGNQGEASVKAAEKRLAKVEQEVEKARRAVEKAKQDEKVATKREAECSETAETAKKELAVAEKEIAKLNEGLAVAKGKLRQTDKQIAKRKAWKKKEKIKEVVIAEPPKEPSENEFGYDKPVYGCFEGEVMFVEPKTPKLPTDYSKYEVSSVLYACEWNIPKRDFDKGFPGVEGKFEWFAIRYSGVFKVDKAGVYKFRINSDDGTKLYIDGKLVVDNDGVHPPRVQSGTVELEAGDHELVLEYFQGPRYLIALQVYVTPPAGKEAIFSVR